MNDDRDQLPVVVGVDGSEAALGACRWGATLAAARGAPLHLVHAIPPFPWFSPTALALSSENLDKELHQVGNAQLDEAEAVVREECVSLPVSRLLLEGPVPDVLADRSEHAQAVVLGAHWSGPAGDMLLGRQTIRVINRARCPVVAWRREPCASADGARPIVVGVDESDYATRAAHHAFSYADTLHVPLVIAHFWSMYAAVGLGYSAAFVDWDAIQRGKQQWIDALIAPLAEEYPAVTVHRVCADSTPARGLVGLSKTAQMVVVGSRGRGQFVGAVLGSVSQNLVHHADCSVLVVP